MGDGERATKLLTDPPAAAPNPNRRRSVRRLLVAGALILLVAGWYIVQRTGSDVNDGFVAFRPDVSQFPAAPVEGARTDFGVGRPLGWPTNRDYCPYQIGGGRATRDVDRWTSVRHDWLEDGEDKAWFISERTYAYEDAEDFDRNAHAFFERTKYCGWQYDDDFSGFTSILIEPDGLPADAVAFAARAAPEGENYYGGFEGSNPEDFHALGAFIPGPKRGQVMNVVWIGWGTDVPEADFVAAVNTLYDAAKRAPKPTAADDDGVIEFSFVGFDAEQAGLLADLGGGPSYRSVRLGELRCDREAYSERAWKYADTGDVAPGGVDNDSRTVAFGVGRWRERSRYVEAKRQIAPPAGYRCLASYQAPSALIETIEVPGLPEGTTVLRWNEEDAYAMVLSDDDKQLIMTITWREKSDRAISEDKLVDVVNRAWSRFQADNP